MQSLHKPGGRGETRLRAHPGRSTIPKDDERWQHVAGQTSEKIPIRAKDAKMGIEKNDELATPNVEDAKVSYLTSVMGAARTIL